MLSHNQILQHISFIEPLEKFSLEKSDETIVCLKAKHFLFFATTKN